MHERYDALEKVSSHLDDMLVSTDWIERSMLGFPADGWADYTYEGVITRLKETTSFLESFKRYVDEKIEELDEAEKERLNAL